MTREFRFRAWRKDDRVMIYDMSSILITGLTDLDGIYFFMQFTGLKDKNDKEIWEGDIVKTIPFHKERSEIFSIKWEILQNCGDCYYDSGPGFNFHMNESHLDHLEAIGNIYENPELLNLENGCQ